MKLIKYPRTPHLVGSRLQPGDEDLSQVPFSAIAGKHLVVEEKIDGANAAISFDESGRLLLQSRGHYLSGGYRERHYNLMKQWVSIQQAGLFQVLGTRYILFGEWMYAKHSIYYDALPHYFMEFDILDREQDIFLSTGERRKLTRELPICSVPVLAEGTFDSQEQLLKLLGPSRYIRPGHIQRLRDYCEKNGIDADRACQETDSSTSMEGLYIKVEENGQVVDRVKFVRTGFYQTVLGTQSSWQDRPIIPNALSRTVEELFL